MKILVPLTYSELGGGQRFLLALIEELRLSTWDFCVLLFEDGPMRTELTKRNIEHHVLPSPTSLYGFMRFAVELIRNKPDIIYLHSSRMISILAYLFSIPCVERINMSRGYGAGGWCRFPIIDRLCCNINSLNIAVSDAIKNELFERGVSNNKIRVIKNYVDVERFSDLSERTKIRKKLGVSPEKPLILNVGRMVPQKNQSLFIEIASLVLKKNSNVHFLIIGEGPLKEELDAQVQRDLPKGSLTFLPFQDNIQDYYAAADILLHTPSWEPLANVTLEAYCSGLHIVASDVEGNREVGSRVMLFPPDDVVSAIKHILYCLQKPRYITGSSFTKERVVRAYKNCFEDLIHDCASS